MNHYEELVYGVLEEIDEPVTTTGLAQSLFVRNHQLTNEVTPKLRRTLDKLEEYGKVVGSGGPLRDELPGWKHDDAREIKWATDEVADNIALGVAEAEEAELLRQRQRILLLRELHKFTTPHERRKLGLVGVLRELKDDPDHSNTGATKWSLDELEAVVDLVERVRYP